MYNAQRAVTTSKILYDRWQRTGGMNMWLPSIHMLSRCRNPCINKISRNSAFATDSSASASESVLVGVLLQVEQLPIASVPCHELGMASQLGSPSEEPVDVVQ